MFGDSLSDSGNNAAAFGVAAGQLISGNAYIPQLPYASGTYSNGPVWATQFAGMLGRSAIPSVIPELGGTDYAFGGAATDGGQVPHCGGCVHRFSSLYLGRK